MYFSEIALNFIGGMDVDKLLENNPSEQNKVCAILTPHAGYSYSGDVSARAFNSVKKKKYENVFILSTSHTASFPFACIPEDGSYETPYGIMKINKGLNLEKIVRLNQVIREYNGHFKNDHTIEIELPFIQKTIDYENIVPIMVGENNTTNLYEISKVLEPYFTDDNLFVISSDFSHYPDYKEALIIDEATKNLILKKNSKDFINDIFQTQNMSNNVVTRMCGWSAYLILLFLIEKRNDIEINVLRYKNSFEAFGDRNRTVGYFGMNFIKK
jgi:hypothetical protein